MKQRERQIERDGRRSRKFKFPVAAAIALVALLAVPSFGATIEATQRSAIVGLWGAEVVSQGDGSPGAVVTNMSALQNGLYIQWSMRLDDAVASPGLDMDILTVRDAADVDLFSVRLRENAGAFEVYGMVLDDGAELTMPAAPVTGTVLIKSRWMRDPAAGFFEVWIDDALQAELRDLNTDYDTRNTWFGAPGGAMNLGGWLALDEFSMWNSAGAIGIMATMWGTAMDPEDGDICASVNWNSDVDGLLGAGCGPFMVALSGGPHAITATAASSTGQQASTTHNVSVQVADGAPVVSIMEPQDGVVIQ